MPTVAETFSMNLSRTASGFGLMIGVLKKSNGNGRTKTMKANCNDMTVTEAMDYVKAYDVDGITLTESGRGAAAIILEKRADWTPTHALMLERIRNGVEKFPFNLTRTVSRTRLGDALDLVRNITKDERRKQKTKLRRRAAKSRRRATMEVVAA